MNLLIVTGMSGAGKSQAASALEDIGFYCVDNIPPSIIPAFVDLSKRGNDTLKKLAVVTDVRGGVMFSEISDVLVNLRKNEVNYKILFLDATDEVLIRRYQENRRKHPLIEGSNLSVTAAVKKERELLEKIHETADFVIDTSQTSIAQLKSQLSSIFAGDVGDVMKLQTRSFGFKYGLDSEADLVFDVRCLPNPFYDEALKHKTGIDLAVRDFVLKEEESRIFLDRLLSFLDCAVPLYMKEGKSRLTIAIGCTGGKHRSVTFAEEICDHLKKAGYNVNANHRDIYKA